MKLTIGVILMTMIWWAFQVMPLPVVSLIPLVAMSLSGVVPPATMLSYYLNPVIFMLIVVFLLGSTINKSGLALRLSYYLMTRGWVAGRTRRLGLAFMLAVAIILLFASDAATVALFLPLVLPLAKAFRDDSMSQGGLLQNAADTPSAAPMSLRT